MFVPPACSDDAGDGGEPECLDEPANLDCRGLYGGEAGPAFSELFTRTIYPTCGDSAPCHSAAGAKGGLVLETEDDAYDALRAAGSDGRLRVRPGDVQCGKVIVRLETEGEPYSMPPGSHLDEPTLCTIRKWIAAGAPR